MIEKIFKYEQLILLSKDEQIKVVKKNTLIIFLTIIGIPAALLNLFVQGRINSDIRKSKDFHVALKVYQIIGKIGTFFIWPVIITFFYGVTIVGNFIYAILDTVRNIK